MVGVGIGPPKALLAAKPTSSVRMSSMFGAPLGALISGGKSRVESRTVGPIWPLKGAAGSGRTSCARQTLIVAKKTDTSTPVIAQLDGRFMSVSPPLAQPLARLRAVISELSLSSVAGTVY